MALQAKPRELRIDDDRRGAGQGLSPDVGRVSECIQALLAKDRAMVAADRRRRRGVVEADAWRIDVIDDDRGGSLCGAGGARECQGRSHHGQAWTLIELHADAASTARSLGWTGSCSRHRRR